MYYQYLRKANLSLKIEKELLDKVKKLAKDENIKTSEYVRRILKKEVIQNEITS